MELTPYISVRKNSDTDFTLLVASAVTKESAVHNFDVADSKAKLTIEYGDNAAALKKVVAALKEVYYIWMSIALYCY